MPAVFPDSFSDYLKMIGRYPLLTPSQEIELSRQAQRYIELRDTKGKPSTPQEKREMRVGKRAFDKMITSNLRLVVNIAKRFASRAGQTLDMMDLISEGTIGLHRAVELFDASRGYKFSTYSYWWVRQAICRAIDTSDRMIRVPIHSIEKLHKLMKLRETFQLSHGREPTLAEAAEILQVKERELSLVLERAARHDSLDKLLKNEKDGSALVDMIAAEPIDAQLMEQREKVDAINQALMHIDEDEAEILERYYGLNGAPQESLKVIGQHKGLSRERIRQKRDRAENKLARHIAPLVR
ncbi:MAG: sigma-70 family RNA polymerase sigma factor [Synechococcaceae bacterium WB9_4xB_025]|nr:sigma-70 family RNA polymerase sigma factor [Synechococcaceae bacterium WB9_4xB_025]